MMKERLIDFVHRRESRFSPDEDAHSNFHSRAYHRFFEGYAEQQTLDMNGRVKIERYYIGMYYRQAISRQKAVLLRIAYGLLWIATAASFVLAATRPVGSNRTGYITCFQAFTVAGLFWGLVALLRYTAAPEKMTVYEYKSSSASLQHAATVTAFSSFLTATASTVWLFLHRQESPAGAGICICGFLLCGAFSVILRAAERKVPYSQEASGNRLDETGSLIE